MWPESNLSDIFSLNGKVNGRTWLISSREGRAYEGFKRIAESASRNDNTITRRGERRMCGFTSWHMCVLLLKRVRKVHTCGWRRDGPECLVDTAFVGIGYGGTDATMYPNICKQIPVPSMKNLMAERRVKWPRILCDENWEEWNKRSSLAVVRGNFSRPHTKPFIEYGREAMSHSSNSRSVYHYIYLQWSRARLWRQG